MRFKLSKSPKKSSHVKRQWRMQCAPASPSRKSWARATKPCSAEVLDQDTDKHYHPRSMIEDPLRYFVVAAKHEHLRRAADELGMSQPTLSRSISRLEIEYKVKLFDRSGRRMR